MPSLRSQALARTAPLPRALTLLVGGIAASLGTLALASSLGCAASSASYTRFRQASEDGRAFRAEEVRVAEFVNRFAADDGAPALFGSADAAALFVDARVAAPVVPREGATAILGVTVRGVPRTVRYATDVVMVLDVSGSMGSDGKIGALRASLARFVSTLDPDDRMAIVTFESNAHVALPLTRVGDARETILRAIGRIDAGGSTNLHAGLSTAERLFDGTTTPNARLLVLTDGVANEGETSPQALLALTRRIAQRDVSITTVGVGRDLDDRLLSEMAQAGRGDYHFVDRGSELERVFVTYGRSITELSARDAEVIVELPPGARLGRVYDDRVAVDPRGASARIPIGDVGASDASVSLAEITLPPGSGAGAVRVRVRFSNLLGTERLEVAGDARYAYGDVAVYDAIGASEPGLYRAHVMGEVAFALREAAQLEARGDARSAGLFLESALAQTERAHAELGGVDPRRAGSLFEPISLLRASRDALYARWPTARDHGSDDAALDAPSVPAGVVVAEPGELGGVLVVEPSAASARSGFAGWRR